MLVRADQHTKQKIPHVPLGAGLPPKILEDLLHFHNARREVHAAPALTADEQLSRDAEQWAEDLARRKTLEHSNQALIGDEKAQGENLAAVCRYQG